MGRRFKSFKSPILNSDEPIEFEVYDQTFRCQKALQGRTLLEFVSASSGEDYGRSAEAVLGFIDKCVAATDRERFQELTSSEDDIVSMDMLSEIASWLVELYSSGDEEDAEGKDSAETESSASSPGPTSITSSSEETPSEMESV